MDSVLRKRECEVWDYVRRSLHHFPMRSPSFREIQSALNYKSNTTAVRALRRLIELGYLEQVGERNTCKVKLGPNAPTYGIPVKGRVSAGVMREAIEVEDVVDFSDLQNGADQFVLAVDGDSMIDAQIADGDFLLVNTRRRPRSGDIVIAKNDEDEATVKFYYRDGKTVRLEPANAAYKPIVGRNIKVLGVVISVIRKLR